MLSASSRFFSDLYRCSISISPSVAACCCLLSRFRPYTAALPPSFSHWYISSGKRASAKPAAAPDIPALSLGQYFAHFGGYIRNGKRLLDKVHARLQNAVVGDYVFGVAGHE